MRPNRQISRPNPLRELIADRQRSAEVATAKRDVESFETDLPTLISKHVEQHMGRLEAKLVEEFRGIGQKSATASTEALTDQLSARIENLEQIYTTQTSTIVNLKNTCQVAEQKVDHVVHAIEKSLSDAVPGGFALEPSRASRPAQVESIPCPPAEVAERGELSADGYVYCPNCTSTKVRRAYRQGVWEEFLCLFFLPILNRFI